MVVIAKASVVKGSEKMNEGIELPSIDLSMEDRSELSKLIVKACEEFGFFKVINHGVPKDVMSRMEQESFNFFAKPLAEKQLAGPPNPFGYGLKKIGFNGDMGDVEYILLHTHPNSIAHHSNTISHDPTTFRLVVSWYIEEVKRLGSEILDLIGEGLQVSDPKMFSSLIHHTDNDSLLRLNHYDSSSSSHFNSNVGIGEHSDPQILTLLASNDVPGLEIYLHHNQWVPVPPDPTAFWVNVGDLLQALSNGRFVSVRHRAMTNTNSNNRLSMAYFAAPPLSAWIEAPKELVAQERLYRPFTWADYKNTTFSLRLGDSRLHLFKPRLLNHHHHH